VQYSPQAQADGKDLSRVSMVVREEEMVEHDRKMDRVETEMGEVFNRKVRSSIRVLMVTCL
jgi:hypothetical protein